MGLLTDYYGDLGKLVAAPEPRVPTRDSQNALGRKPFDPNKASVAETLLSFTPVAGDVLSAKDAVASLSEGNYLEAALNGAGLLPFVPSLAKLPVVAGAIKAFHGTPHTFKPEPGLPFGKFKKEAIGSGEGHAAYGYGTSYSAENPAVGKEYQKNLTTPSTRQIVNPDVVSEFNRIKPTDIRELRKSHPKLAMAFEDDVAMFADRSLSDAELNNEIKNVFWRQNAEPAGGHLLELSHQWPDAARETADPLGKQHLLDWDRPLSEQRQFETIKNAAAKDGSPERLRIWAKNGTLDDITASQFYKRLGEHLGSDRAASEYLHSLGIPGIKYLDGTSRGAGQGTHNFVMFEPEYTKITARDGITLEDMLKGN